MADVDLRAQVRARYAAAALAVTAGGSNRDPLAAEGCCGSTGSGSCFSTGSCAPASEVADSFGAGRYSADERSELPPEALAASLGCGNPLAVAELRPGERVLDLGSGGGIDTLLSARRVGETGFVYGVDMTDEMLALARANAAKADATNLEFRKGTIEAVPLPDATVDVVISNCVINLSADKPRVLAEAHRVLRPGGRLGICDVAADDHTDPARLAQAEQGTGCGPTLTHAQYRDLLRAAGFTGITITSTHPAGTGLRSAIIQAARPASGHR